MEIRESRRQPAEQVRDLMVETALRAYEDAGYGGRCVEGRWEAAVRAMQAADLSQWATRAPDESTEASASTLGEFAAAVAKASPSPGGGSVAAVAGMLAASLVQMAAKLSPEGTGHLETAEKKRVSERAAVAASELSTLASHDAEATKLLASAHKAWSGTDGMEELRVTSLERALLHVTEVPFDIALLCAEVAEALSRFSRTLALHSLAARVSR
ncbi:MAG: cyclodeaminase/cyclohydrolase family protein [Gemmatimonadaceae bacterium]